MHAHYKYLDEQVSEIDRELHLQLADDDSGQRLMTIPGIGPITASVLASDRGDGKQYGCGRDFAASIGLVPRPYCTGGKANLLGISKRGDKNTRRLLVQGAHSIMRSAGKRVDQLGLWIQAMMARRHPNVVAYALANKLARIAWTLVARHKMFETRLLAMPG